jgi:hypothetical protein
MIYAASRECDWVGGRYVSLCPFGNENAVHPSGRHQVEPYPPLTKDVLRCPDGRDRGIFGVHCLVSWDSTNHHTRLGPFTSPPIEREHMHMLQYISSQASSIPKGDA